MKICGHTWSYPGCPFCKEGLERHVAGSPAEAAQCEEALNKIVNPPVLSDGHRILGPALTNKTTTWKGKEDAMTEEELRGEPVVRVSRQVLDAEAAYQKYHPSAAPLWVSRGPLLATNSKARKDTPMARGLLDYFPRALAAVAELSRIGNDKHNPGQPLHWSRDKSSDHADCIVRHLIERGTIDQDDGVLHSVKVAWRALALLEIELEAERRDP